MVYAGCFFQRGRAALRKVLIAGQAGISIVQAELSMHEKLCCIDARTRPVAAIGNTRTSRMALEHSIADPSKRRLTPYSRASLQATGDRADPGLLVGAA